jgi:signal transduction histidine kinase/ActR/RegA family two-component response regulator
VTTSRSTPEEGRLLILAPVGKDAALASERFAAAGIPCKACRTVAGLAAEVERGAAAVLVAEEALGDGVEPLASVLERQPMWSDLPVLLLTRPGADSVTVELALRGLGNVILLERPMRVAALVSAASMALRARARQYQSRAQLQSLEEADRRKDEFLATLAHELRNPLAPMRNAVELLRLAGGDLPAASGLADMMGRQVSQMVRLVDDLLEISRITRGTIELRRGPVELSEVVTMAVETSRPMIDAAGHRLEVTLPDEPVWLDADATRLAQVVSNLLNNAAKYTDPGGQIALEARREDAQVALRVRDSGMGIEPTLLPTVFEMFSQGKAASGRAPGGVGIGLTLVRGLVQMHGGTVTAESDGLGRGSVFTVRLPAGTVGPAPVEEPHSFVGQPAGSDKPEVLVVDDNADAAESLAALLDVLGARSRVVHDGTAAIAACQAKAPEIIFLDIGMPQMDGYEVARRIRALPGAEAIHVVALTGWGQDKDRRRSEAAGFDRHLVKPVDVAMLQSLLLAAGGVRRPSAEVAVPERVAEHTGFTSPT